MSLFRVYSSVSGEMIGEWKTEDVDQLFRELAVQLFEDESKQDEVTEEVEILRMDGEAA